MISIQELARDSFLRSTEILLKTYAAVPEDKLLWSPSATAKSATQLVAHIGLVNEAFAGILTGKVTGSTDVPAMFAELARKELTIKAREKAIALIEDSTAGVVAAIESITDAQVAGDITTPFGVRPLRKFIFMPEWHVASHSAQIDYLQTTWGDLESHA